MVSVDAGAQANDNLIQVNGVIVTSDTLRTVADATIQVKNKNRGVESANTGVFSIVCFKGDTLEFSCIGFRSKEYVVSKDAKSQYITIIQPMIQDTFYLPETIVRPLPSREAFNYAFTHWRIPNDYYEKARRNTNSRVMAALAYTLPRDGRETQNRNMAQQAKDAVYYGQQQPMNLFNPLAWGQFFDAWKRGDFRKTDNTYYGDNY